MQRGRFQKLVRRALHEIPPPYSDWLDNIDILIERRPTARHRREAGTGVGRFVFVKQKAAREIGVRLVGSEMSIRDGPNDRLYCQPESRSNHTHLCVARYPDLDKCRD